MSSSSVLSRRSQKQRQGALRLSRNDGSDQLSFWQKRLPLPWALWPAEGRLLLTLFAFWSLAGLMVLGSASWWVATREMGEGAYYLKRQLIWMAASWSLLGLAVSTSLRRWLKLAGPALWLSCFLVAATLVIGSTVNGASRWLVIGPLQIQPSELVKPFVVLQAANLFAHWQRIRSDEKLLWLGIFGALLLLILKQPNLSTAALTGMLLWLMALAAGLRLRTLLATAMAGGLLGTTSILINEYQRIRVISFLDPWQDPQGSGYQLVQSLLAIGSGGWFGEGFGLSTQKLQYLPIQSTDFIYAVFAEEFGFVGSVMMLLFLMLVAFLGLRVALSCRTNQSRLVAIGCTTILVGQAVINVAVASGVMPTTGLPLPMVSYGGNSLLSSVMIAGLLIRCSLESTGLLGGRSPRQRRQSIG
ncbi:Cell division protein FtsW [Prochlorococcus marinus str. MIT 9313]|uniref:Probable peptidoglycan glycosyltransferase FtsW n=1 Tax=Prochlorococcus marinus (strain MIT 9313) TaxID=74547 RepID=Q7V5R9_PROMM|nr:FtsW/RodA/SpoVE family cell cycle protein [Prochlorococcus marinus]MED5264476.1 FtsW/RodA/SpoVE family cell cycle protein [Cyanobacteriota bacterium]KZR69912.1 Lipid II flippase FtsW [Prochlorococcus marinus str. MIT 1313]KZR72260.1 Lipid II flippase FtsW [Prochlorococcus marinus str. MIT 1318]MED5562022.1 FtsW/RodA/SpoVE family cell cycle protein [Cyanobacteriota bacterium]CAE21650.1 Cell division protein FtsW [Prochlorococcus marinus str. MIT 9313]